MPTINVVKRKGRTLTKNSPIPQHNFLKYWRVVRYWAKRKYDISDGELEMMLYLYDIPLFTRNDFKQFEGLLSWDKTRLNHFIDKGWIVIWREHKGYSKQARLYELSTSAKRICLTTYKKLTQEEHIPENSVNNPVFKGNNYADKMYRKVMKQMNKKRDAE